MAIVQVSRITQRKGLQTDLPQPLAGAEIGWSVDQRRLFIGNGTLQEGAPAIGNTEILTQYSDVLSFITQYTYKGQAAGYTVVTSPTGAAVVQSLQSRLDSYAVISDFGPVGDGVTDVTADINNALFQLYCRSSNPSARRSLFFPAGVYIISDTLNIPPHCTLYGEGPESTIISFYVQTHTSTITYPSGVLVSSSGSYYRSKIPVPIGTLVTNTTYWDLETLPAYIVRTADSLQQTGVNIATNGATAPTEVSMVNMGFVTNQLNSGILVEDATKCSFEKVSVTGPLTTSGLTVSTSGTMAVAFASTTSLVTTNVTFNQCDFGGFVYATNTQQQIQGVTFSECNFDTLYQGAYLGGGSPVNGGPNGVRFLQNTFDNIYAEGIVIYGVGRNISGYNTFYDVGNHFNGYALAATSIISINANENVSVGDMFGRNSSQSLTFARIDLGTTNSMSMSQNMQGIVLYQSNAVNNTISNQLNLGTYQRTAGITDVVADNAVSSVNLASVNSAYISTFKMDYTIARGSNLRTGTMSVASGTGFVYSDDYVENASTGVTLAAAYSGGNVTVTYTSTSTGSAGSIYYSITSLG